MTEKELTSHIPVPGVKQSRKERELEEKDINIQKIIYRTKIHSSYRNVSHNICRKPCDHVIVWDRLRYCLGSNA